MPMPKRKPNYDPTTIMQELLTAVCDYYGDPVDDRKEEDPDHVSLHDVAERFDISAGFTDFLRLAKEEGSV